MNKKRYTILLLISLLSIIPLFISLPYFSRISFGFEDFSSQVFYYLNKKNISKQNIVLVAIDDYSFKEIGQSWPIRRSVYAKALNILSEEKAKVVGFDLIFEGKASLSEDDAALSSAIKDFSGKVVLGYFWDKGGLHLPEEEFRKYALLGFINSIKDGDGIERKCIGYVQYANSSDVSFAMKLVSAYKNYSTDSIDKIVNKLQVINQNEQLTQIKEQYSFNVVYLVEPKDIATVQLYDLLNKKFPKDLFKDKIVIIGPTLEIAHDIHETPLGRMPGVLVHINVITDILEGRLTQLVPFLLSFIITLLAFLVITYILTYFTFLRSLFLYCGVILFLFWANIGFKFLGWQIVLGNIILSSLIFVTLGNLYNYIISIAFILKIKNKLIKDPFTNLFNVRYFSERFYFDSKNIFRKNKYLVAVFIDGYKGYSKAQDFEQLKNMWNRISILLFSFSYLWTRYADEIVAGSIKNAADLAYLKQQLEGVFSDSGVKIKLASLEANQDIDPIRAVEVLVSEIQKSKEEILYLSGKSILYDIRHKPKQEKQLYSLYLDAEDKNIELLKLVEQLKGEEQKAKEAYFELITSLVTALESKDSYTKGHTQRVCNYAIMLADKLKLPLEEKERIRKAALLHDLGKIGIPDNILHKKGKLTDEEFSVIKEHEVVSAKILEPIKEFKDIIPYVLYHHENFDGSGYPHGLASNFIPLGARIIAVADMFDALTTGRSYKMAFSIKDAADEIEKAKGKKLDPVLADKFIESLKDLHLLSA